MPLTELAIAAGALLTGIKSYRKRCRQREINRFLLPEDTVMLRQEDAPLTAVVEEAKDAVYDFTHSRVVPMLETVYEQIRSRYRADALSAMNDRDLGSYVAEALTEDHAALMEKLQREGKLTC